MPKIRVMDDRFLNENIVYDECSKLDSVYRAIEKWEVLAIAERNANPPDTSNMSDLQARWAADHFDDQAYMIHVTKQAMLGSLAVTMASSVENYFGAFCEDRGIVLGDRAGWGQKRQGLEATLGINCETLAGFRHVTRVRLLGNCFKHNHGRQDAAFVDEFAGVENEEINFDSEDWPSLIDATRQFLLDLVTYI
jgi:hypothetical protein